MTDSSSYRPRRADAAIDPDDVEARLRRLHNETGYNIVRRHGQRIYGGPPPGWEGEMPGQGTEVYCYRIPRDCFEDELVPVFSNIGQIFELRLMLEFSGTNRTYCYVRYTEKKHATEAIRSLDGYEIRRGHKLAVTESNDNRRISINGMPKNRTIDEIKKELGAITSGIINVVLHPSQPEANRTSLLVEYESHRAADQAKRKLTTGKVFMFGLEVGQVEWANAEPEVDDEQQIKPIKILYVRHLNITTTDETLWTCFTHLSNGEVDFVKKIKNFAYVHLTSRESAELVMTRCDPLYIDDQKVEVLWSNPPKRQTKADDDNWKDSLLRSMKDPSQIVSETEKIVIIKDMFPKAREHYMVLPREDICDIYKLKPEHLPLLQTMEAAGLEFISDNSRDFMMGFHAEPHLNRLHLHVISKDLDSNSLWKRKHWNIFTTPYFISLKTVKEELMKMGKVMERTEEEVKGWRKGKPQCHICSHSDPNLLGMKRHIKTHFEDHQ